MTDSRNGERMSKQTPEPTKSKRKVTPKAKVVRGVVVTPSAIILTLDAAQQRQMKQCLKNSGKVTLSLKEISVTQLPATDVEAAVIWD